MNVKHSCMTLTDDNFHTKTPAMIASSVATIGRAVAVGGREVVVDMINP